MLNNAPCKVQQALSLKQSHFEKRAKIKLDAIIENKSTPYPQEELENALLEATANTGS